MSEFKDRSDDMTLSTFIGLSQAEEVSIGRWKVSVVFKKGDPDEFPWDAVFKNVHSEFEAKERCFLYLQERVRRGK